MNEAIDEFYMLKKNYMNKKTNRCINCNRSVGTNFKVEYFKDKRVLKIECGSIDDPCDLKKEVIVVKKFNRNDYINDLNNKKKELEDTISKLKNKLLYELISEKEYNDKYDELSKEYTIVAKEIEVLQSNTDKENMEKDIIRNKLKEEIEQVLEIESEDDKIYNIITKVKPISELYQNTLELIEEENNNFRVKSKK
jgi:predicted ribosome quality control (RQC) complex YloA/Tae2 family protein